MTFGQSGDDDGALAAIMATMATSCEPFTSVLAGGSTSTTIPGDYPAVMASTVAPRPIESVENPLPEIAGKTLTGWLLNSATDP